MRAGEHKTARAYVLYREERRKLRDQQQEQESARSQLRVTLDDGKVVPLDIDRLTRLINSAAKVLKMYPRIILLKIHNATCLTKYPPKKSVAH